MSPPLPWSCRTRTLLLLTAGLVAVADLFFYRHPFGWAVGLYGLLLLNAVWLRGGRGLTSLPAAILTAAIAALALMQIEAPGLLGGLLLVLGLITLALTARSGWTASAVEWFGRWGQGLLLGWTRVLDDRRTCRRWRRRRRAGSGGGRPTTSFWLRWGLPLALGLVFVGLFAVANPLIERWLREGLDRLGDLFDYLPDFLSPGRWLFWLVLGVLLWGWLRLRIPRERPAAAPPPLPAGVAAPAAAGEGFFSAALLLRSLGLFNLIFAVQTVLDLRYLWGGAALPAGMTYAEYAHRGAYPLVVTALLAAAFVLIGLRENSSGAEARWRWVRRLVYLWLAQNVFLVVSAGWRLWLYVGVYSLTRWRVAAGLWMLLVVFGLLAIVWRIARRRDGAWLLNRNVLATLVLLYAACCVNWDGRIAWFNVRHCREAGGPGPALDLEYLERLGPEALPAVAWLQDELARRPAGTAAPRLRPSPAAKVRGLDVKLRDRLREELADWRGWSWRRARLAARYPSPPPATVPK